MTRAGRWLRVSTNAQDEASQEPDIDRWIAQHGYDLAETYRVHGASAFHGEHEPELRRAMADMAAGKIEVLVVWKSDRLERRGAEALMGLITEAAKAGGRIEFVTEPALNQASDPLIAPMLRAFYGAVAHHESATKADRSKAKHAALRAAGSWMAGQVPYGYVLEAQDDGRKVLVPDPDTAPVVKRIFAMVASGVTPAEVARTLTAEGVPTCFGKKAWADNTILQMVGNPCFRGHIQHRGVTYMIVEPLTTAADWLAANQHVAARAKRAGRGTRGRGLQSPLRPVCGECGGPLYNYEGRYRCAGVGPAGNSTRRKGCGNTISFEALNAEVITEFAEHDEPEILETVTPGRDYAEEVATAQLAIKDLDVLADDYDERHAALIAELRRLRALPPEAPRVDSVYTGRTEGDAFSEMTEAEQRAFIRLWTLTVYRKDSEHPNGLALALVGRRWMLTRKS